MAKEWTNPYSSFNSMKVLLWKEQLEAIVRGEFMPPVTVDTDPTNLCNYNCIWCNSAGFRKWNPSSMPPGHLVKLADFYKEWGVYSTCVAGGGESTLHPEFTSFLYRLAENGIQSGVITNGSVLTEEKIEAIAKCSRWCGFSIDAGDNEVYMKMHGVKDSTLFGRVLKIIGKLAIARDNNRSSLDIAYKFLIHPDNASTIYKAAEIARDLGVNDFHLRPVGWDNLEKTRGQRPINFASVMDEAKRQMEAIQELETDTFHVYGITHKFGPKWERKINFEKCRATPLLATFGADGKCHLCFDMRGREDLILCSHYPDPHEIQRVWGSARHKELIERINPQECPRCTFGPYNEIIEQVIIKDKMCRYFP